MEILDICAAREKKKSQIWGNGNNRNLERLKAQIFHLLLFARALHQYVPSKKE